MSRIRFVFALVLLFVPAIQAQPDRSLISAIDSIFAPFIRTNAPGGSVVIQLGGRDLYRRSFGLADLRSKRPFTEHTIANLGSISKTFVAYAILQLEHAGKLSLDNPISDYFSDFRNPNIARSVTIRHMLTHTSGLPDLRPVDRDSVFYLTADDAQNFAPLKSADSLEFEPGSRWKYSNPAFNGLALIVEQVSGMRWQRYVEQAIFIPAGMQESRITDGASPSKGVAHGYQLVGDQYEEYDFGEYPTFCAAGNGGVWSSVEDLVRYARAIEAGVFLDPVAVRRSHTLWRPGNWSDTTLPRNGFSWFVLEPDPESGRMIWYHHGEQGGFIASFVSVPDKKLLVILEMNLLVEPNPTTLMLRALHRLGYY